MLLPPLQIENELADELVAKCPMKVFDLEDLGGGARQAVVARPRACTLCRECIRDPAWDARLKLRRVRDHFLFSVESVGVLPPKAVFLQVRVDFFVLQQQMWVGMLMTFFSFVCFFHCAQSVALLKQKCQTSLEALDWLEESAAAAAMSDA